MSHETGRPRALRSLCLIGAALPAFPCPPAFAQEATRLPDVDIASDAPLPGLAATARDRIDRPALDQLGAQSSDTGRIVTRVAGVGAYGAGGLSSLPTIRGLDNQRISILVDGVPIDIACPNNMNPPLSYTDPQTIAAIDVVTGVSPVSHGGDTIGGAILVETAPPAFAKAGEALVRGRASTFYRSNGDGFGGALTMTAANDHLSLTYSGAYSQSGNYRGGGDDDAVRATNYARTDHSLAFAAQTGAGLFELRGGFHHVPYEGFPNQYMDMTDNRSWFLTGRYRGAFDWGDVDLTADYRDTDHEMNFLADKGGTADGGMPMNTETHSAGVLLRISLPLSARDTLRVGGEFRHEWLNDYWPPVAGSMMMGPDSFININGAKKDRLGTFLEWQADWSAAFTTTIGVRNDQVWMNTGAVRPYGTGMMQMDDVMAAMAFNAADHRRHDDNWSGSVLLHYGPTARLAFDLGYARKVRSPTIYERYTWGRGAMASRMIGWFGDGNGYVGNLALDPERADTVSGAVTFGSRAAGDWSLRIAPYYTHVADYIDVVKLGDLTDMMGMPSGFALLQFANREAAFYGVDVTANARLLNSRTSGMLIATVTGSWQHGRNLADHDPLYHQMPFNASLALDYSRGRLDGRVTLDYVADRTRVDPTRNEPRTGRYALVGLGVGYGWRGFRLGVDVSNLFDKGYASPLGGLSLGDYGATGLLRPVPGRGRSLNVELSRRF